jgi:hypothetical protein
MGPVSFDLTYGMAADAGAYKHWTFAYEPVSSCSSRKDQIGLKRKNDGRGESRRIPDKIQC